MGLIDHNGNKNRASKKLSISKRQIDRLIIKYKKKGKAGFIHSNRTRKPLNTFDNSSPEGIVTLYKNKYYDFNFNHFKKFLKMNENINVSYKFIYNTLTKDDVLSPKARKKAKRKFAKQRLLREKKINSTSDEQIKSIITHEVALEDSHPRGEKSKYFGKIIEQDGSIHLWFGKTKTCLHLAIDKATSTIVGAWFDKLETLNSYYHVIYQILTDYGIPYKFLTDNCTVFNYVSLNLDKRTSDKDVLTKYGYACKQLGVDLETTSVYQAKGLIERTNETFQGRLVQELRLNNINTIKKANKYLLEIFIPYFNQRFALDHNKFLSVLEKIQDTNKINYTLSVLTIRKIDNRNTIKFKNKYYQPYLNGELKYFMTKIECLVIESYNGDLLVSIDENIYEMKRLLRNTKYSKEFDENIEVIEIKEKKKYIHPFKAKSFKEQIQKAQTKHVYV